MSSSSIDLSLPCSILPIPAFRDNYLWLMMRGRHAVVIDPGEAEGIEAALQQHALRLDAILLTHHHQDHTGGVAALLQTRPGLPVYGPRHEAIAQVNRPVAEPDEIDLPTLQFHLSVLDVPGHTRGHIAYFGHTQLETGAETGVNVTPILFCGDTLFAGGCGRLFEGTAEQMHQSLAKLSALPDTTRVYCAHEYTIANLAFAHVVEPDNPALQARRVTAQALRDADRPTIPTTIALEKLTNPFLRADVPDVRAAAERCTPGAGAAAISTFAALREWKNHF